MTPQLRQARLYQLTPIGRQWMEQAAGHTTAAADTALEPPLVDLYSWVQAGCYRRLVLRHLNQPLTVRDLRRRILQDYQRIGSNHVRATLRDFASRELAARTESLWDLTQRGRAVQRAVRAGVALSLRG